MKKFGKRTLSMLLAFALTASMLISDLSVMQVSAAGSMDYTANAEDSVVELMTEELTEEESVSWESASEEVESQEWTTEEASEDMSTQEEVSDEVTTEETILEGTDIEEISTEETTLEEESDEVLTTEACSVEETLTEEESVSEEVTEKIPVKKEFDEGIITAKGTDEGFTLWVDEDGVLSVSCNDIGVTKISGSVTIPKEARIIPADTALFKGNTLVTKVTFEEGSMLERIEDEAFFTTSALTEIKIPVTVSYIGEKAFHASGLKKVVFETGENATPVELGNSAFQVNTALTTVVTGGRLQTIGESAFAGNAALKTFVGTSAADAVDEGALDGVTAIGARAFSGCSALEYITIPDTVAVIEEGTFENCTSLGKNTDYFAGVKSVKLGNGVTSIGTSAFAGCSALTEISIPASVTYIGVKAFDNCNALKKITIKNQDGTDKSCAVKLTDTSFPYNNGLVLEAYDGTVKDWVGMHASYGIQFTSLYENYAITYAKMEHGSVKANKEQAKVGATVALTVTPEEGYTLKYSKIWYTYIDKNGDEKSGPVDPWKYTFEMPEYPVQIHAIFVKLSDLAYGEILTLSEDGLIDPLNTDLITYDTDENVLNMGKVWQTVKIQPTGSNGEVPGSSELEFTSANAKIATVDAYGNIRSVAKGETTISVSLKDESKGTKPLEIAVKVGQKTTVNALALEYTANGGSIQYATEEGNEASEIGYDIITYPASTLKLGSKSVRFTFDGRDLDGHKLDIAYQLSSNDAAIAKPSATKMIGTGKFTIPKDTAGETFVTVKAVDGSAAPLKKQFIIRVIDDTPRLAKSTFNLDPQSESGALLELVSVYGNLSDADKYKIVTKEVVNGVTKWENSTDTVYLHREPGSSEIYLKAQPKEEYKDGKVHTYKDTYYISGELKESGTRFYILLPTINISMKKLDMEVKLSGKINLFYNNQASVDKTGKVIVKPKDTKTGLKIKDCELIGKKNSNGVNTKDDESFAENFKAEVDYEKQRIIITRNENAESESLLCYTDQTDKNKLKGKAVTTGILRIYFEGYSDKYAKDLTITVPTHTTAPVYKAKIIKLATDEEGTDQEVKKISLNQNASGHQYTVSFIDKATKKAEDLTEDTVVEVDYRDGATPLNLIETEDGKLIPDEEADTVPIIIADASAGKIVMNLSQPDWEMKANGVRRSVKVSVNVAVSNKVPKVTLGKSILKLNAACPEAIDNTSMTLNQADSALLENQDFQPVVVKEGIENIHVYYDSEKQTVNAQIIGEVSDGVYKFRCTPWLKYNGENGETVSTDEIIIKVKVNNTLPSVKLKNNTFKVNAKCYNTGEGSYDSMVRTFSWVDLPAEYSGYELSMEDMTLVPVNTTKADPFGNGENVKLLMDAENKELSVWIEADRILSGSAVYKVTGLKLVGENGSVDIKPFKITVKSVNKAPKISVTAKGTINPLKPDSQILYTTKLTDISGGVENVKIRELTRSGGLVPEGEEHFEAYIDSETGKTVLRVKTDSETGKQVQLEKRTYTLKLYYELTNGKDEEWYFAKDVKVTPKQTMPKLTIDKKSATFFAGDKSRTQTITVTQKDKVMASIVDVKFSDSVSKKVQEAFAIDYDVATGKMELRLVNSAFIKQNVNQKLTFEIVCDGQLANTKGRTFEVTVKVIK